MKNETPLQTMLNRELREKEIFEQAKRYAFEYFDTVSGMDAVPSTEAAANLSAFEEPLPESPAVSADLLNTLQSYGMKNLSAQGGGRYFGFVNGGALPASLAARWMADAWDQNAALYVMSPLASKLEEICERWLVDLFGLPEGTAAGFVSGSSAAILCALAAARDALLSRQGWDAREQGLWGAPRVRVVLGEQAHSSVVKSLSLLGFGKGTLEYAPVDGQGRIDPDRLPSLDDHTLLILQAGNVNSGAFDPLDTLSAKARAAGAWTHVDGAFGLWAAASPSKRHLVDGLALADSWSTDAHKTLNAPYDNGVVFCRDRTALVQAMQASGSYIIYSERRDGMLYTQEMSRRARSVELWAALKSLGRSGVSDLVDQLCENAAYFASRLLEEGFSIQNDVMFNQVLVACGSAEETKETLARIQSGGVCWCGGAVWKGEPVIRVSVCSWRTTHTDIDASVRSFVASREAARSERTQ